MRLFVLVVSLVIVIGLGCGQSKPFDGPTVDKFVGRVVQDGKPITVKPEEHIQLSVFHEKGTRFGIPLKSDGTFEIGWMPIGKYSVMLERDSMKEKRPPTKHSVPGGMTIEEGKTEYTIDLGKGYKP